MSELGDRFLPESVPKAPVARFPLIVLVLTPLATILFQVYVPRFIETLSYLAAPLLVTVYFCLMMRSPVVGLFFGAGIGLVQDSLSHQPLGMFGIVKTLVGYFAATMSQRFEVNNDAVRFILACFFYLFHQLLYWVLLRALLGQPGDFDPPRELILGLLNAMVAVPLYRLFDKLKTRG